MSKGRRSPSPRFLPTRCLSWIAAGLAAAATTFVSCSLPLNAISDLADGRLHIEPAVIATPANIGMAAHGTTQAEFAAILDEQRAKWAAIAHNHDIKPVHG